MKIVIRDEKSDARYVELEGDLDFDTSPDFRREFTSRLSEAVKKIVINLKKVPYVDSSGLATFIELYQKLRRSQGELLLCNLNQGVRSVFEIAKLDTVFHLVEDEGAAA